LRRTIGERVLVNLDTHDIDVYSARVARERGPATADMHLRLISSLWKFSKGLPACRRRGRPNPTFEAEKHYKTKLPHEPWPAAVQQRFLQVATPPLRLAFLLLLYTGQRRSDVVAMKWADYDGTKIYLRQKKTGQVLAIHVHRRLKEALDAIPRVHDSILINRCARPYESDSLTHAIKRTLRSIGAEKYTLHGLRKSAGVALAELGRSELEIMSVLGHKTPKMATYYCRQANRALLNESAIKAWEAAT